MKTGVFMLILVGLTSIGSYWIGARWLRLPVAALRPALDKMLECVGAALLFSGVNVVLATFVVLALRGATGKFLSVYMMNDVTWFLLSLGQALIFQWWRELAKRSDGGRRTATALR